MTAAAIVPDCPTTAQRFGYAFSDSAAMTKRNLYKYVRLPQLVVFSTIQPVMFILLFYFVFGGAISGNSGLDYIQYVLPGILVQSVMFGSASTGIGLADDLGEGVIDRFRSLPMARSAVLAGRTAADTARNLFVVLLMIAVGYILGFRFVHGWWLAILAILFALLVGLSFCWIQAYIGLSVKDPETVQVAGFIWIFPLVFASSAFVPTDTMPGWLQVFADNQPVTKAIDAIRWMMLGDIPGMGATEADVWAGLAWMIGILIVFVPLTVNKYRRLQ